MSDGEQGPKAIFLGVRSTALTRNELEEKTKQEALVPLIIISPIKRQPQKGQNAIFNSKHRWQPKITPNSHFAKYKLMVLIRVGHFLTKVRNSSRAV